MATSPETQAQATALAKSIVRRRPLAQLHEVFEITRRLLEAGYDGFTIERACMEASVLSDKAVDYQLAIIRQDQTAIAKEQRRNGMVTGREQFAPPEPVEVPSPDVVKHYLRMMRATLSGTAGSTSGSAG